MAHQMHVAATRIHLDQIQQRATIAEQQRQIQERDAFAAILSAQGLARRQFMVLSKAHTLEQMMSAIDERMGKALYYDARVVELNIVIHEANSGRVEASIARGDELSWKAFHQTFLGGGIDRPVEITVRVA